MLNSNTAPRFQQFRWIWLIWIATRNHWMSIPNAALWRWFDSMVSDTEFTRQGTCTNGPLLRGHPPLPLKSKGYQRWTKAPHFRARMHPGTQREPWNQVGHFLGLPSGFGQRWLAGKSPINGSPGTSSINGGFSITTFDYRRVCIAKCGEWM